MPILQEQKSAMEGMYCMPILQRSGVQEHESAMTGMYNIPNSQ